MGEVGDEDGDRKWVVGREVVVDNKGSERVTERQVGRKELSETEQAGWEYV